eukprot:scaffold438_cov167-Amphora_coffeaeformis.AAC.2
MKTEVNITVYQSNTATAEQPSGNKWRNLIRSNLEGIRNYSCYRPYVAIPLVWFGSLAFPWLRHLPRWTCDGYTTVEKGLSEEVLGKITGATS